MQSEQIEGDPQHTSTRLRKKAVEILAGSGRPMAGHEIESWIRANDPILWSEISDKCPDYTRIILSLTKGNIISKFKSLKVIKGIDRRAIFYGLISERYPPDEWQAVDDVRPLKQEPAPPQVAPLPPPPQPEPIVQEPMRIVDEKVAKESWIHLSTLVPLDNPMWTELLQGIHDVADGIMRGADDASIVGGIVKSHTALQNRETFEDVVNILCREILVRKEMNRRYINPT